MQLEHTKTAVVGAWVLAWGAIAVWSNVSSAGGWMLLVGVALTPPLLLARMWHRPAQTMSESIHDVLK